MLLIESCDDYSIGGFSSALMPTVQGKCEGHRINAYIKDAEETLYTPATPHGEHAAEKTDLSLFWTISDFRIA